MMNKSYPKLAYPEENKKLIIWGFCQGRLSKHCDHLQNYGMLQAERYDFC